MISGSSYMVSPDCESPDALSSKTANCGPLCVEEVLQVWNPHYSRLDQGQTMPILTPVYPAMNCAHNVTRSGKRSIELEVLRGYKLLRKLRKKQSSYAELFKESNIFDEYENFLRIDVVSEKRAYHFQWLGTVESKLRRLITSLERETILHFRTGTKAFENRPGECGV